MLTPAERLALDREIAALVRAPFARLLGRLVARGPTEDDIAGWAKRAPDRWAQAVASLARLAGYSDQIAVVAAIADVRQLPDAELARRLALAVQALESAANQALSTPQASPVLPMQALAVSECSLHASAYTVSEHPLPGSGCVPAPEAQAVSRPAPATQEGDAALQHETEPGAREKGEELAGEPEVERG